MEIGYQEIVSVEVIVDGYCVLILMPLIAVIPQLCTSLPANHENERITDPEVQAIMYSIGRKVLFQLVIND